MGRDSGKNLGHQQPFLKRYTGACIGAVVTGIVAFVAISTNDQYGGIGSRIANGVGALFAFGGIALLVGILVTSLRRSLQRDAVGGQPSVNRSEQPKAHDAPQPNSTHSNHTRRFRGGLSARQLRSVKRTPLETCGIFISYRRQDEPNFSGRLYDTLAHTFGADNVFMDIDSIEPGLDFEEVINQALSQCKVLVVILGKSWLNAIDAEGRPRLDDPHDYVRVEIETALKRGIRAIPILVEGASMPKSSGLPGSLASLSRRNGMEMSYTRFRADAEQLVRVLQSILRGN